MSLDEMEMPTPCKSCGNIFDLHDGYGSEKWYPNTVICKKCKKTETKEIERDYEIEDLKDTISDAEFTIKNALERLSELGYKPSNEKQIEYFLKHKSDASLLLENFTSEAEMSEYLNDFNKENFDIYKRID